MANGNGRAWKLQIYSDSSGAYRWRLLASNGAVVASSNESFESRSNAVKAANMVRTRVASVAEAK